VFRRAPQRLSAVFNTAEKDRPIQGGKSELCQALIPEELLGEGSLHLPIGGLADSLIITDHIHRAGQAAELAARTLI